MFDILPAILISLKETSLDNYIYCFAYLVFSPPTYYAVYTFTVCKLIKKIQQTNKNKTNTINTIQTLLPLGISNMFPTDSDLTNKYIDLYILMNTTGMSGTTVIEL